MSQRVEIWVDHLEQLAQAARIYDDSLKQLNRKIPGNFSDLEFDLGSINVSCGGVETDWTIQYWEDATHLVIEVDGEVNL